MKDFNMDDYSALKGSTLVKGLAGSEQLRLIVLNLQLYSLPESLTR